MILNYKHPRDKGGKKNQVQHSLELVGNVQLCGNENILLISAFINITKCQMLSWFVKCIFNITEK